MKTQHPGFPAVPVFFFVILCLIDDTCHRLAYRSRSEYIYIKSYVYPYNIYIYIYTKIDNAVYHLHIYIYIYIYLYIYIHIRSVESLYPQPLRGRLSPLRLGSASRQWNPPCSSHGPMGCVQNSQKSHLVGGFNRLEKYESRWEGLSHILWNIKHLWNHQPAMFGSLNSHSMFGKK